LPVLSQFSDECKQAIKKGAQVRLIFEGDSPDGLLREKVKKLIDGPSVHVKFYRESLNHFIMSDDKEVLIPISNYGRFDELRHLLLLWKSRWLGD
jgi:hypothetical protein